jgi:hypothetical protein
MNMHPVLFGGWGGGGGGREAELCGSHLFPLPLPHTPTNIYTFVLNLFSFAYKKVFTIIMWAL